MISAGDIIDNTLGVKFGLATLTAAACGQVVSDVCGVCFGGTVEALATKLGLPSPDLTLHQRGLKISRLVATSGAAVGVVCGCMLGMLTLLFVDTASAEREKKQVRFLNGYGKACRGVVPESIFFSSFFLFIVAYCSRDLTSSTLFRAECVHFLLCFSELIFKCLIKFLIFYSILGFVVYFFACVLLAPLFFECFAQK